MKHVSSCNCTDGADEQPAGATAKGGIQDQIIEGVYTVAEDFPRLIDASETMKPAAGYIDGKKQLSLNRCHLILRAVPFDFARYSYRRLLPQQGGNRRRLACPEAD